MGILHEAAKSGDVEEVQKLILAGFDVNEYDEKGNTVLIEAVIGARVKEGNSLKNTLNIIDILLNAGANINSPDSDDDERTALHWAADFKNVELVEFLLKRGASVHSATELGCTPLFLAISPVGIQVGHEREIKLAQLLLEYGSDINAHNRIGYSPLSCSEKNPELYNLLLKYGIPGEKSKREIELEKLLEKASRITQCPQEPISIKSLEDITLAHIRENKNKFFKDLPKLSSKVKEKYPDLEIEPKKRFIYKLQKIIEQFTKKLNPEENKDEFIFLEKFKNALSKNQPYNEIHEIISKDLDVKIKQESFLSAFKANMQPIRKEIVLAMKEYNQDKEIYSQYFLATRSIK